VKRRHTVGTDVSSLQELDRLGLIEICESMRTRKRKTQLIVAWKAAPIGRDADKPLGEKEERIRVLLETERGPLPLPQLLRLANVARSLIERMLRDGLLESWEEPLDPAEDPFDAGYPRPAPEPNPDPQPALTGIPP